MTNNESIINSIKELRKFKSKKPDNFEEIKAEYSMNEITDSGETKTVRPNRPKFTTDYDIFKFLEYNRYKITKESLDRLIKSIKERNLLHHRPILVNEDFYIIDGQHRLLAAKELKVPIFYTISEDFQQKDVHVYNEAQKQWVDLDYLNYYEKRGNPHYKRLKEEFINRKMSLRATLVALSSSGSRSVGKKLREGSFQWDDQCEEALFKLDTAKEIIDTIAQKSVKKPTWLNKRSFQIGLIRLLSQYEVQPNDVIEAIENNIHKIHDCTSAEVWMIQFKDIYNMKKRGENRI